MQQDIQPHSETEDSFVIRIAQPSLLPGKQQEKSSIQNQNRLQLNNLTSLDVEKDAKLEIPCTKRSDESEFQNWEITTIRSGKFVFEPITKTQNRNVKNVPPNNFEKQAEKSPLLHQQNSLTKVYHQQSIDKLHAAHKSKENLKSVETLENSKLIKHIFVHFCKDNYLGSIKSTLFENKQKSMEEMTINKWMVFCKEFDIFSKLCSFQTQRRKQNTKESQINLENSQISEQLNIKKIKEVERNLSNIFRKCSENHTKMILPNFVDAIRLLHQEFRSINEESPQSQIDFIKQYLFCSSKKQCMSKLSNLKFTFGIPQIDYDNKHPIVLNQRSETKSKFQRNQAKQNRENTQTVIKRSQNSIQKVMKLNPIIKQAKKAMEYSKPSIFIHKI